MRLRMAFALFGAFAAGLMTHSVLDAQAKPAADSPYAAMGQLGRVLALVENEYVDPVDRTKLVNGAIAGMVDDLDPHSSYMPAQEYKDFQDDTEGKFAGIGVEVDIRGDVITVLAPIEGSPAFKAGIKSGDRILAVDGQTIRELGYDKLVRRMRGTPGTHVHVTIARAGHAEPLTLDLVRAEVHMSSARGRAMAGGVAYVQLKVFQDKSHDEFVNVVAKIRQESKVPITGVLFDLRSNPGGLVDQASAVADEFLSSGTIYTMRHRGQISEQATAHGGGAFVDVPVVVLVNEQSASAAELVAGALQDLGRGTIVGATTFGKGVVQSILDLPGGAGLKLTTARYYTPSGHAVQADGIHPDVTATPLHKPDGGMPIFHESDYEGAMAGEGSKGRDGGVVVTYDTPDAGSPADVLTQDMPEDPRTGRDPVMRIGYEVLLRAMKATGGRQ
ncbi:MAG TPA: S41 family peptidase [Polyangiaceae bacterium]|nr:S41 family peptidase [Polyangiaceae bacterium]